MKPAKWIYAAATAAGVESIPQTATRWLVEFGARLDPNRQPRRATANGKTGVIAMQQPVATLGRLITLAHELGHVAFGHGNKNPPRYVMEFQAGMFEFALMARDGIACPDHEVEAMRFYVGQQIAWRVRSQGRWVDPCIIAWARAFVPDAPGLHRNHALNWMRYRPLVERAHECNDGVPDAERIDYYAATLDRLGQMGLAVPAALLVGADQEGF